MLAATSGNVNEGKGPVLASLKLTIVGLVDVQ